MKIKSNFILRKTAGTWIAMEVCCDGKEVDGVLTLNDSGALLWNALVNGCEREDLVAILMNEYDVDTVQAAEDVNAFITKLQNLNCLT